MIFKCELRGICIAAVLFAMVFGQIVGAKAQDCDALEVTAATGLNDFLEKKLIFAISSTTIQLIRDWRAEYGSNDLLSAEWAKVNGTIAREGLTAEQAEVAFLEALAELKDTCAND
jgi:hypothetical protein